MQLEIFVILILPWHVSAALGHHQVLLLKLSHCNFYIICSFRCVYLFICLMPRPTLFPFSSSPLLVFKILKIYVCIIKFLKTLFLLKLSQPFLLGVLHSSSYVVCLLYHLVLLCVYRWPYDVVFLTVLLFLAYEEHLNYLVLYELLTDL
jgi:hypothetical protein